MEKPTQEDKNCIRWLLTIGAAACQLIGGGQAENTGAKALVRRSEEIADALMDKMPEQLP